MSPQYPMMMGIGGPLPPDMQPRLPMQTGGNLPPQRYGRPVFTGGPGQMDQMRIPRPASPLPPTLMTPRSVSSTGLPAQPSMPNGRPPQLKPPRLG